MIPLLNTSCSVYQSGKDEMVSQRSICILEHNPCVDINILKNAGHYYYEKADWEYLTTEFQKMLNGW